ncbi:hypothetical protein EZV62_018280 [Acer yangbiense]|uniref:Uncharacterized protein n=1 Tax=Acer yangbiense TaxID=1000413 RepID=A0A5C7HIX9_9ROSI|nr:hypothetical protein EZV62_018280 [Acer yangbiense]
MGSRVPVQPYNLRSANSFISTSLHDLNTVDSRPTDIDDIRDSVQQDGLDNDDDSTAVNCMHESYRNSLPLHNVGVEEDHSSLENSGASRGAYDILTIEVDFEPDVSPIESARARFLQIIVDYFINHHVIEVADSETDYTSQSGQDKLNKRKTGDVQYEGDPRFALPMMYVANLYESLVNDANLRLASLNGIREKTIGVALEAAGGLYRSLAKKFPKKGACVYKRRELATSLETRTRFPELVIQEEKRVRFVVVNGLDIVEKPSNIPVEDADWFKRLTGRIEVAISAQDYKFYSPRHKYRRITSNSMSNIPGLPSFPSADNTSTMATAQGYRSISEVRTALLLLSFCKKYTVPSNRDSACFESYTTSTSTWTRSPRPQTQQHTHSKHHMQSLSHQPQFHHIHQNHHQHIHQSQHPAHFSQNHRCTPPSNLPEITHAHQSPAISQHMACLQPLTGGHVGERLHVMATSPAKYCDECGAPYLRETSKFCSECGVKRLGI